MNKLKAYGLRKTENKLTTLISKGEAEEARAIIEKAHKEGVDVVKDISTVNILEKADIYEGIPEEAYKLVTEILMYIYDIEKKV